MSQARLNKPVLISINTIILIKNLDYEQIINDFSKKKQEG